MIGLYFLISIFLGRRRQVLTGLIITGGLILGSAKAEPLPQDMKRGEKVAQRLQDWQSLIVQSIQLSDVEKLKTVNDFFNRHIRYGEDIEVWRQFDYWASPRETLELGAGDCEDFALAKYFTLRLLGISEQRLRLVYSTLISTQQAHMVLGYRADGGDDLVLLDNLRSEILLTTQRPDLQVQFAFDSDHMYRFDQGRLVEVGDAQLLPVWQVLKAKVKQESLSLSSTIQLVVAEQLHLKRKI
ncbi:transglutaminase-like cysteine peptidase [Pseudomonas sp. GD03696]|uniref:transglutaminase-like cysteine peptidase n=1 Tax=Pseudomonas sp. GD03696 TaxID=2975368 RepID=UPI002448B1C8|nr:transglutaminase-like cysteine peptidase [Pseudomonas sp. GD03696]MDH1932804.1 transglutaminase-like cysteine peptidase [Pseudomonas sp. GD03696]